MLSPGLYLTVYVLSSVISNDCSSSDAVSTVSSSSELLAAATAASEVLGILTLQRVVSPPSAPLRSYSSKSKYCSSTEVLTGISKVYSSEYGSKVISASTFE